MGTVLHFRTIRLHSPGVISRYGNSQLSATSGAKPRAEESKSDINRMFSERDTVVELPSAADSFPWVGQLRTVLSVTVGIRDGAVHLVST
jgi:hypothetical protein